MIAITVVFMAMVMFIVVTGIEKPAKTNTTGAYIISRFDAGNKHPTVTDLVDFCRHNDTVQYNTKEAGNDNTRD